MQRTRSGEAARAAIKMALSRNRADEQQLKKAFQAVGIMAAAVDHGGDFISSVKKVIERAVVAAKREGLIAEEEGAEGGVAGAAREALSQIMPKALGLNMGGKIGIARYDEHIVVVIFCSIGLLHLNEVAFGLGHRAVVSLAKNNCG
ncbi:MAG: hut operon positive regulator HutP [Firmicutes bacterium]|nr:hut operon positive regulator HutP [Bacillota bacterium]